ncbi:glycosyltransferase family 4 protein [Bacillus velezensis]|uniref:glycosyltransferase family 4 protein n=1 Tax=Bacillus velezensis TaxID=492670 RepID=UPI000DC224CA|nr:glycosyltransferase family 4 protein [Bacillus velezensis]MED3509504.1 glycosyltransferase family 4 protein [Bacillus velezensis]RAP15254.1 hypothetical protein HS9_00581 [Bacillus velezensis]
MKIAIVSSPYERTPPEKYGGLERVVNLLTEGLVDKGHDITLFGAENSITSAKLISYFGPPVKVFDIFIEYMQFLKVLDYTHKNNFDLIHCNNWYYSCLSNFSKIPIVTTLHVDLNLRYSTVANLNSAYFVAISHNQKKRMKHNGVPVREVIYNSLDISSYDLNEQPDNYFAFLGMIAPHKGLHHAIYVAKKTGIPLKIGGKNDDPRYQAYFEKEIKPHIDGEFIQYLGELDDHQKKVLLRNALATLFPIEWHEPFGLVMIESMACGTPVIAFNRGSVQEIVQEHQTGYVVQNVQEMCNRTREIEKIDRKRCHNFVRKYFNKDLMISNYERLFLNIIKHPSNL